MQDRIKLFLAVIGLLFVVGGTKVSAHEGRIVLKNATVACEGISIWRDDRYQLTGRCQGLVYPYQERLTNYILWIKDDSGSVHRVTNIDDGLFTGFTDTAFSQVFISVEDNSSPRQPGDTVIASGNIQPFDFNSTAVSAQTGTVAILPPSALPTPTPTAVVVASKGIARQTTLTLAVIIGVILAVFAAIFVVRRGSH